MSRGSTRLGRYLRLVKHSGTLVKRHFSGHLDQGVGRRFEPGRLAGYFNDLSVKVEWTGAVDSAGVQLVRAPDGKRFHHPIMLFQKALGHWDLSIFGGLQNMRHQEEFLRICRWAVNTQDENGGWEIWNYFDPDAMPYSAMAQGEAMSALARAFSATEDTAYLQSAKRALDLMLTPLREGGVSWSAPEGLVLEEVPFKSPKTILNGWIFALHGLYDLTLVEDSPEARQALESTMNALLANLSKYNAGYWSFYDTSGKMASPFYHRLHIAQLAALEMSFPQHAHRFEELRDAFQRHLDSRMNRTRAFTKLSYQKLLHPPNTLRW